MALSRTWYVDANIAIADGSTAALTARSILWGFKSLLKGNIGTNTQGLWTVEGSSDGTNAGMDGVDRWLNTFDATKIVRAAAGVAHSWIVLKSPATIGPSSGSYYMLIDYSETQDQSANIVVSPTPFTGGTTLNAPTSTKSWTVCATTTGTAGIRTFYDNTVGTYRMYRITDANGNFWFTTAKGGQGFFQWLFGVQTLVDTRPGDQTPTLSFWSYANTGRGGGDSLDGYFGWMGAASGGFAIKLVRGRFFDDTAVYGVSSGGIFAMMPGHTSTATGNRWQAQATTANPIDGKIETMPVWFYSVETVYSGVRGRLPDVSWVSYAAPVGASEPTVAAQERMVVGGVLIPCPGAAPVL